MEIITILAIMAATVSISIALAVVLLSIWRSR